MSEKEWIVVLVVTRENIERKAYVCNEDNCLQQFSSEKSLKKHLLIAHLSISERSSRILYRFNCPISTCRRSLKMEKEYFTTRKHLYQHYYKVHNSGKFNCEINGCDKCFSTEMLRNLHQKNCGKVFTCHCNVCFNSREALLTHQRRKHPTVERTKSSNKNVIKNKSESPATTRTVSTTTSGLGLWKSTENLSFPSVASNTTSVFTSTDQPISSICFESKSTTTKLIKDSSTSTSDVREENSNSLSSSSSQNKKNLNWSVTGGDFDDSINLFDSDVKMEFYTAETQTDFNANLFNNNYTQTTFSDLYDFEKFDIQTQTNWDE